MAQANTFQKSISGSGDWSSASALVYLPKSEVQSSLPKELKLLENFSEIEGMHPVFFMFGIQEKVRSRFKGRVFPPYFAPYLEFILAVPGVTSRNPNDMKDPEQAHIFLPLLYLDRTYPVWVGVKFFGYNKLKVKMQQTKNSYKASKITLKKGTKPTVLSANWKNHKNKFTSWRDENAFLKVNQYLSQPVISVKNKKVKCFPFSWQIEESEIIQTISLEFNLGPDFLYKFSKRNYVINDNTDNEFAFYYKKSWVNHLPISCKESL